LYQAKRFEEPAGPGTGEFLELRGALPKERKR